jgi:hypothetical protein
MAPDKVDLGLLAWRRLKARFEAGDASGAETAHPVPDDAVASGKAPLLNLTEQPARGEVRIGRQALAQVWREALDEARRWRALLVGRRPRPLAM